jgi:hypothetical protein
MSIAGTLNECREATSYLRGRIEGQLRINRICGVTMHVERAVRQRLIEAANALRVAENAIDVAIADVEEN